MARRPLVSRERILAEALVLVDREGLDAVSMRRVGEALGIEAMSLYNHLPSKAVLLDGIFETVLSELPPMKRRSTWRSTLRQRAVALREVLLAHPNAVPLFATRPAVTTASLGHIEDVLAMLVDAGFATARAVAVFQVVVAYVVGHTLSSTAPPLESGPRYGDLDPLAYPHVRAAAVLGRDLDGEFELGLEALVRGLPDR